MKNLIVLLFIPVLSFLGLVINLLIAMLTRIRLRTYSFFKSEDKGKKNFITAVLINGIYNSDMIFI